MASAKLARGDRLAGAHRVPLAPAGFRSGAAVLSFRTSMASARSPREYSRSIRECSRRLRDAAGKRWPGARLGTFDAGWPVVFVIVLRLARLYHPTGAVGLIGRQPEDRAGHRPPRGRADR